MDGRKKAEYYTKICGVEPNATEGGEEQKNKIKKSHGELKGTICFFLLSAYATTHTHRPSELKKKKKKRYLSVLEVSICT